MVTWAGTPGSPSVSGSTAVTTPGSYAYSASGGAGSNVWSCEGTGASIDQNGNLSLSGACGLIDVTCTDCCGNTDTLQVQVTNGGSWLFVETNCYADMPPCPYPCYAGGWACNDLVDGIYKYNAILNMQPFTPPSTYGPPCSVECSDYANPTCFDPTRHYVCYSEKYIWGC